MKRIVMTVLAMLLAVSCTKTKKYPIPLFEGFGGEISSEGTSSSVTSQGLLSISVEPANRSIPIGIPQDYTAMGIYSDGYTRDITTDVTWSSGDTAVATIVANTGEVTGVSAGGIQITATLSDISGTGNLTVTTASLVSIEVVRPNPSSSVASGTAIPVQFTAIGTMSDGTTIDLTKVADWTSSDTGQATVDNSSSKGSVTGVAAGTPTITASYSGINGTRDITVTTATLTSISIDSDTTITVNGNKTYRAIATFSDGSTQDITSQVAWSTGDTNIATIETGSSNSDTGLATGKTAGSTSITATYNGISASSTLTVVDSSTVSSLSISPSGTTTIGNNTKQNYTATVTYSDGSTKNVTSSAAWTSSSISVAGISNLTGSEGVASGVSAGSTTITASFGGKSATATLTVAEKTLSSITVSNVTVSAGSGKQLTATATYSDGSTQDVTSAVTWNQVADTSIAEVSGGSSDYGTVYGKSAGDSTITATLSGVTSNAATVSVKSLTSIAVTSTSVAVGSTAQLTATGTYSDGSTEDITDQVTWTPNTGSGDTTYFVVGNVDGEKGLVTGKSAGSADATATLYGAGNAGVNVSGSGTITVTAASGGTETKSVSVSSTVSLDVGSTTTVETKPTGDFDGALLIIGDENTKAFVANITGGTLHSCADVTCLMDKILQAISEDDFDFNGTNSATTILETAANGGYNLVTRRTVSGTAIPTEVASVEITVNSTQTMAESGGTSPFSVNDMRNHYVNLVGKVDGSGTISDFPTTGSGATTSTTFRIEVQASKDSSNTLIMLGITAQSNFSNVEVELTSLINGTNIAPTSYSKVSGTKNFTSEGAAKVDFLVSVNNSATMEGEQSGLKTSLSAFYTRLASLGVDFRMSLVTSDCDGLWRPDTVNPWAGVGSTQYLTCDRLNGEPATSGGDGTNLEGISDWGTGTTYYGSSDQTNFETAVDKIWIRGWSLESNLYYAEKAIATGGTFTTVRAANSRSSVPMTLIVISDDPDQYGERKDELDGTSTAVFDKDNNEFVSQNVTVHAVYPMDSSGNAGYCEGPNGTTNEAPKGGSKGADAIYPDIVEKTGGMGSTICASNPSSFMELIADQAAAGASSYSLDHVPITNTLQVLVNGTTIEMGFASSGTTKFIYNSATNKISFTGDIPTSGTPIVVNYSYHTASSTMNGLGDSMLMAYTSRDNKLSKVFVAISLVISSILGGLLLRRKMRVS